MSRDDRDWYREAIRERDSKNKVVQFDKTCAPVKLYQGPGINY